MDGIKLFDAASIYLLIIQEIEKTSYPERLVELEDERARWHNTLIDCLKRAGIPFRDREHVTWIARSIVRMGEWL